MKKILLVLALSAGIISCNKAGDGEFVLSGTVEGADGKSIILERQDDSLGIIAIDTAKIENGKFKFTGVALEPEMHSLAIETLPGKSYLILEDGKIDITIHKDSIHKNKVAGTYNNDQLQEFTNAGMAFQKKLENFQRDNEAAMVQAQNTNDTATVNKLRGEFLKIQQSMEASNVEYVKSHPKAYISVLLINNMFRGMEPDAELIQSLYNGLDSDLKKTKAAKNVEKRIAEFKAVTVGKLAPNFTAPNPDGKPVSLKESLGKVTIIDFWASWCGPCRAANPELVALYNELHPQGLNIIGVSLDKPGDEAKWKQAIAKDQLTWTQVSNLKHWQDPIATMYGIQSIPQMFVLNSYGVVVAKDLKGEVLKDKIKQLLAAG